MLEAVVQEISFTQMGFAVLLKPITKNRVVPIFIGPLETYSISNALQNEKSERPLTHDLMKATLVALGYKIEKVYIDDFKSGTFYAKVFMNTAGVPRESDIARIDARPSDAIALALRFQAPIFMAENVYEQTSVEQNIMRVKQTDEEMLTNLAESLPSEILTEEQKETLLQTIMEEFGEGDQHKEIPEVVRQPDKGFKSRREVLQQMLETAVSKERYEDAARIRDEITTLEKSESSSV